MFEYEKRLPGWLRIASTEGSRVKASSNGESGVGCVLNNCHSRISSSPAV